jgi:hypothetical protein
MDTKLKAVSRALLGACTIAMALAAPAARAESFPTGDVFRPLVADPLEPRSFISVIGLDADQAQTTAGSVGLGFNYGFHRWEGREPGDGWQVGLFASFNSQFDLEEQSYPLINTDYRVGVPVTYRSGRLSMRARLFHQSSHLGDEFILSGNAPRREDLSVEVIDFVAAYDLGEWRPYGGAMYIVHRSPGDLKRTGFQAGIDYVGRQPVLFGGRLVGGLDVRSLEENDWRAGVSAKAGLEFGRQEPQRRAIRVMIEAFDGPAPFGQFYREVVTSYGLAVQFDY